MSTRAKKFLSYYRPYLKLLFADLCCAFVVSAVTLSVPLIVRYVTGTVLAGASPDMPGRLYQIGPPCRRLSWSDGLRHV